MLTGCTGAWCRPGGRPTARTSAANPGAGGGLSGARRCPARRPPINLTMGRTPARRPAAAELDATSTWRSKLYDMRAYGTQANSELIITVDPARRAFRGAHRQAGSARLMEIGPGDGRRLVTQGSRRRSCHDRRAAPAPASVHGSKRRRQVRAAEDAWNSRDPERVSLAYTAGQRGAIARVLPGREASRHSSRANGRGSSTIA